MKPPLRTKSVGTKVSEAEFALLEERARGAGMRLAEWVREALLSAPMASGPDSGEVGVGEILALRSLLLNLHFRAARVSRSRSRKRHLKRARKPNQRGSDDGGMGTQVGQQKVEGAKLARNPRGNTHRTSLPITSRTCNP